MSPKSKNTPQEDLRPSSELSEDELLQRVMKDVKTLSSLVKDLRKQHNEYRIVFGAKLHAIQSMLVIERIFSTITAEDLRNVGIVKKHLAFQSDEVTTSAANMMANPGVEAEMQDLRSRIQRIYGRVDIDHPSGSRMIIEAMLLSMTEILSISTQAQRSPMGFAILPGIKIAQGFEDEVKIDHPTNLIPQLRLTGPSNVDHLVVEYKDIKDHKERLLSPGGSKDIDSVLEISQLGFFIVQVKSGPNFTFVSYIPEAVGQAISLLTSRNLPEVRFCLTDGAIWMFFILKRQDQTFMYYQSAMRFFGHAAQLRQTIVLLCEWLRPTKAGLYTLE
ncbi:hypothetical protein BDN72DRAFT_897150 [Pluteus cervinus]|uniref:Uncharacterized protein n=1 Tax=Pluteus cervinus TaxID=181527 RepID=A0ACD3AV25_9AGAR|nr:hypothetical protein BDN72DRAFT_897150 [Pluteus cervinus]